MSKSRYAREQVAFGWHRRRRAHRFLRPAVSRSSAITLPTIGHHHLCWPLIARHSDHKSITNSYTVLSTVRSGPPRWTRTSKFGLA